MKLFNFWDWVFPIRFYQTNVAAAAIGAAVVGAAASNDAAKKGSYAQRLSADQASAQESGQYERSRADQAPWRLRGNDAGNRLQHLMGLDAGGGPGSPYMQTSEQLRNELMPLFTRESQGFDRAGYDAAMNEYNSGGLAQIGGVAGPDVANYMGRQTVDEAGLRAAIESRMAQQQAQSAQYQAQARQDPAFGSLMKQFTNEDFVKDPGYQFRLDEGQKGVTNQFARAGGLLSGAALKAASRYNQDYASNEFSNAFNRDKSLKADTFNMLSGISGTGQVSANQVANQGTMVANSVGQNMLIGGAARASGYRNQNNATQNALAGIYGTGKKAGWWEGGYSPNADGIGGNPYQGYDAANNGGWGIE